MNPSQLKELSVLIDKHSSGEGVSETSIPGVYCYKATTTERITPGVYNPSLCVIAQGRKQAMLDKAIYHYGPSKYLIVSVDLPMIGQVIEASKQTPYLCLKINIDLRQFSELLLHTERTRNTASATTRGLFVGEADEVIGDSVLRLARLLDTPDDIPVLAPMTMREIYYRLLRGEYGDTIAQTALRGSNMQRIATIIQKLKSGFHQQFTVEQLAECAGMSVSSFHAHFKTITLMSPLQFQKHLRLMEARRIMLADSLDAAHAAYQVGYESPSQFSREYTRMFGNPPGRDISLLKQREYPTQQAGVY